MNLGLGLGLGFGSKGSVGFVPTDIAGLKLWLRADLGIVQASNLVSQWNDQSGTGDANKNVTASSTLRPTLNATDAAYNNKPTLSFNGANQLTSGVWASPLAQPSTVFIVGESHDVGAMSISDGGAVFQQLIRTNVNVFQIYAGAGPIGTGVVTPDTPTVFCAVFHGAASKTFLSALTATDTGDAGSGSRTACVLGSSGGAAFLTGKLAEVLMYDSALDAQDMQRVASSYLGTRYGIAIGA